MSGQIFISYRREDASHPAGRLYEHLAQKFPRSRIFMDIDNIDPGEDFTEVIESSVGSSDILIAVIGRHWLDACDSDGNRRLDNPDDFVRLEVSNALKRGIRVMPVLVDGAVMPRPAQLPEDLQPIIRRQAVEVTHNRFAADSERIIQAINRAFEKAAAEEQERLATEQRQREEAEARQRAEKERLEVEQREKERLEAEEGQRAEQERVAAEQREREEQKRLGGENREREEQERLVAAQRQRDELEVEQRQRESASKNKTVPGSPGHSPNFEPLQPETTPIVRGKGSTGRKPLARVTLFAVIVVILIVGLIWFASHGRREAALVTPIATPQPTPTPANAKAFANAQALANAQAYYTSGTSYFNKKDYTKAISDYSEAIKLDPNYVWAYMARGLTYREKKDYDNAISDFSAVISLSPLYGLAYYDRGLVFEAENKNTEAQADFDKAKQLGYTGP